ncbi:MAG: hypothetical protein KF862_00730 [Chitinophagaceae bacterium]|nr:hypothetical protein [Chitinophagaceae bacterium]
MAFFAYACSSPAGKKSPQTKIPGTAVVSDSDGARPKDSIVASDKRTLTAADVQYLDFMIIEEHPEVILFHENKPETIDFANELKDYFKSRNADMRENGAPTPEAEKGRSQKFYVHHVGDNLFRVYVFDEWR